jgi:hypothetical protein
MSRRIVQRMISGFRCSTNELFAVLWCNTVLIGISCWPFRTTCRSHLYLWWWGRKTVPKCVSSYQGYAISQKSKDLRTVQCHIVYLPARSGFTTVPSSSQTYVGTMYKNSATISVFPIKCTERHSIRRGIENQ